MASPRWTAGDSHTPMPMRVLANLYVAALGRKRFYGWNQRLLNLAVRGMGVGNPTTEMIAAAEARFLRRLNWAGAVTVFDVGAHIGDYAARVRQLVPQAEVWCFEPHPGTFQLLSAAAVRGGFTPVNLGLSDEVGLSRLYDHNGNGDSGSPHATLHSNVIEVIHQNVATITEVGVTTIDDFMQERSISHVHLLKIDAEGHELSILRGARRAISDRTVDVVQFEFNEMNVMSRVFFRDFYDALPGFSFYRMVVDGLAPIGPYRPRTHELFILQNVVAIRDDLEYRSKLI